MIEVSYKKHNYKTVTNVIPEEDVEPNKPSNCFIHLCNNDAFLIDCTHLPVNDGISSIVLNTSKNAVYCFPGKPIYIIFKLIPLQKIHALFGEDFNHIDGIYSPVEGNHSNPCITLISDGYQFSILNTSPGWKYDM